MEMAIENGVGDLKGNLTEITMVVGNKKFEVKPILVLPLIINKVISINSREIRKSLVRMGNPQVQSHRGSMEFFHWLGDIMEK